MRKTSNDNNSIRKINWLKSIVINAVILIAVMLCTRLMYETNDDYAIASRLQEGYAYVGFVNYFLCKLIIAVQGFLPEYNVYILMQLAMSFLAFTAIYKLILDRGEDKVVRIAAAAAIALFSLDHYCSLQFSKTAALLMVAGIMLLIDAITVRRNFFYYILGIVFLYFGVALRADGLLGAIGFGCVYGLVWLIQNRRRLIPEGYFTKGRLLVYILLIAVVAGAFAFDKISDGINKGTEELKTASEYNIYRSNAVDFQAYESYAGHEENFEKIGIDENDLYLIDHWFFDTDGAASLEKLKSIDHIKKDEIGQTSKSYANAGSQFARSTIKAVKNRTVTGLHIVVLCLLAVWMIISLKPKHWPYIILAGGLTAALYIVLYYYGRPTYRAMYIADIGAITWLMYYFAGARTVHEDTYESRHGIEESRKFGINGVIGTIVIVAMLGSMVLISTYHRDAYKKVQNRVMPKELSDYIAEHEDTLFVFATTEKKTDASYLYGLKAVKPENANVVGTGSWGTGSPYLKNKLAPYGAVNPIKDLIDNDKALYIGNKNIERIKQYYNKWYGGPEKEIRFKKIGEVAGMKIWQINAEKMKIM